MFWLGHTNSISKNYQKPDFDTCASYACRSFFNKCLFFIEFSNMHWQQILFFIQILPFSALACVTHFNSSKFKRVHLINISKIENLSLLCYVGCSIRCNLTKFKLIVSKCQCNWLKLKSVQIGVWQR